MQAVVTNTPHNVGDKASSFEATVDRVCEAEWNELLEQFTDANFYQTWAYGAVSWAERQLSHCVLVHDGQPAALAQLRIVRLPIMCAGIAYVRWGPCCRHVEGGDFNVVLRQMVKALVAEYVERRGLMLRIIPQMFSSDPDAARMLEILCEFGFFRQERLRPYHTFRIDLAQELADIRKRFDGKWRNQLNAAERGGFRVVEDTRDELYGQFIELYDEMMARKRFDAGVDPRAFRRIQRRLPDSQKMLIMICVKDGVPHSGIVASCVGETGIYLLGATGNAGLKSKGSYLLQWRMIQRLKERGCRWYDLGGINPATNPGVYHFKQGMGGVEVTGLGSFALSKNSFSRLAVSIGEKLHKLRSAFKTGVLQRWNLC